MPQKRMECFRLLFNHLAWIEHQFLSGIRDSRMAGSLWGMMRRVGGVRKSIDQSWLAKGLGLGLLCWGFKGVQEEIVGGHVGDVLDVWSNKVVQWVQVEGGGGAVREGYKIVALLLKPSLGLFGLVGRRWVLLPHPGSTTGHLIAPGDHHTLQHIQAHFGIDFQADFEDVRWHDVALIWNHTKDHNHRQKLCFHHPVIHGNPDLHFEGASNDPVFITCYR